MSSVLTPTRDKAARHLPGEAGVWVFILGDMTVFALFFVTFMYYRAGEVELFTQSQAALNQNYGVLNTLFLLASSWFVILGVTAARNRLARWPSRFLTLAFLCGLGFATVKFFEYGEKISHGITLTTNNFFMYYYIFTGIHFLHVMIGMGVLLFLIALTRRPQLQDRDFMMLESGASYWHMVDLLWIVLFPLLYLIK